MWKSPSCRSDYLRQPETERGGITDSRRLLASLAAPLIASALFRLESPVQSEYEREEK